MLWGCCQDFDCLFETRSQVSQTLVALSKYYSLTLKQSPVNMWCDQMRSDGPQVNLLFPNQSCSGNTKLSDSFLKSSLLRTLPRHDGGVNTGTQSSPRHHWSRLPGKKVDTCNLSAGDQQRHWADKCTRSCTPSPTDCSPFSVASRPVYQCTTARWWGVTTPSLYSVPLGVRRVRGDAALI